MVRVQLAGISIQMNNRFPDTALLCRGYETEEAPRLVLTVSPEEIEAERAMQADIFSEGYLESVCLYRKLALEVLNHQVFLLHAAVIEVDGVGYGFLAPSGTGKTTQMRLWLEHFGSRARVINGDKPLIRMVQEGESCKFLAYGTPWCGKEGYQCNASTPLKALYLLERAEMPQCIPATPEQSLDRLFRQLLLPSDLGQMDHLLSMVDQLLESVNVYLLRCNMTADSVLAAYDAANAV